MINSKTGDDLSSTQKDLTLMMLKAQNDELLRRVNEQESLMRKQFVSITDRIDKAAAFGPVNVVKVKVPSFCSIFCFFSIIYFSVIWNEL
jgi:hypothetical protein